MSGRILMTYNIPIELQHALTAHYTLVGPLEEMTPEALPTEASNIEVVITKGGLPITPTLLDSLPSLKLIHCYGTGYDRIDLDAAKARGITVTNAGAANASAVAEYTMAMLLTGSRGIIGNDAYVRQGKWDGSIHGIIPLAQGLVGHNIGIYGLGEIGKRIATRAAAMEMHVGYHGRAEKTDAPYSFFPSLLSLAEWSDVLVVAVRAGDYNRHAINSSILKALGKEGFVINISRGYVVDESALVSALQEDQIAGAALDVFEHEPEVPEFFKKDERIILSPHVAPHTYQAQQAMRQAARDNIDAFYSGQPLSNIVV